MEDDYEAWKAYLDWFSEYYDYSPGSYPDELPTPLISLEGDVLPDDGLCAE